MDWVGSGKRHGAGQVWESPSLSEDIWWWFAQRGEPRKDPCHYFLPAGGGDGQHARARRRMRWCNEFVGPHWERKWKRWGDRRIQSISKRIWTSWKGDSDLELLWYMCARVFLLPVKAHESGTYEPLHKQRVCAHCRQRIRQGMSWHAVGRGLSRGWPSKGITSTLPVEGKTK